MCYRAARLAMGTLNAADIKLTIHALVDRGFFLDAFADALKVTHPRMDEVLPALLAALRHMDIALPDKEQAVWHVIVFHLRKIASGSADPVKHLGRLVDDIYYRNDFHTSTRHVHGHSHGIEHLIEQYWRADAMLDCPEDHDDDDWSALHGQIIAEANEWLIARQKAGTQHEPPR